MVEYLTFVTNHPVEGVVLAFIGAWVVVTVFKTCVDLLKFLWSRA